MFGKRDDAGLALPVALFTTLVMLAVVAGVVYQVRAELRMAAVERDAAQGQVLLMAAMREAAVRVRENPELYATGVPDPSVPLPASSSYQSCNEAAPLSPDHSGYCLDILRRIDARNVRIGHSGGDEIVSRAIIPVAIRWRFQGLNEPVRTRYGWLLVKLDQLDQVISIYPVLDHRWCRDSGVAESWCAEGG